MKFCNEDLKDESGKWIASFDCGVQTRLGRLFNNVQQRAKVGGSFQRRWKIYEGVSISEEFSDFQRFCNWCVQQAGWGLGYDLDKDLLKPGNTVYCPEHCVFLPRVLNLHIASREGRYLPGAVLFKTKGGKERWIAQAGGGGTTRYLGRYATEQEAHEVYCANKEALVKELANQYRDTIDPRAFDALMEWKVDRNLNVENSDERQCHAV